MALSETEKNDLLEALKVNIHVPAQNGASLIQGLPPGRIDVIRLDDLKRLRPFSDEEALAVILIAKANERANLQAELLKAQARVDAITAKMEA